MNIIYKSVLLRFFPIFFGLVLSSSLLGQGSGGRWRGGRRAVPAVPVDGDGVHYDVTRIGEKLWFVENLRTTTYNDGEPIPFYPNDEDWINGDGYCYYNNDLDFVEWHGMLYGPEIDWDCICPTGWRVATDEDWDELEVALGLDKRMVRTSGVRGLHGKKLKSIDAGGTNETGFNGSMGGYRLHDGTFAGLGEFGAWVSLSYDEVGSRVLQQRYSGVIREERKKKIDDVPLLFLGEHSMPFGRFVGLFLLHGQSIRCVQ